MSAFADLSELINRATGGNSGAPESLWFQKAARVSGAAAAAAIAGQASSLWQYEGSPAHGAAPGAVAAPDNTTNGGLKQTDPGGSLEKWLLSMFAQSSSVGTLMLYDRLLHISGLSGLVGVTEQTVGGTLSRYTGSASVGNQIWAEIYTQIGTTATTLTANYTDQDGNASSTSQAVVFGGTGRREAQRLIQIPLASGDTGVRAVAGVTVGVSTGTAGDFGINVVRPLGSIVINSGGFGGVRSFMDGPMPKIQTDACLALAWFAGNTSAPDIFGNLFMAER